ncbi:MAG: Coenzyme F420 hydrogenase/dehydrogenase, beta subunit C-terminal domain [Deltaproteobacteria bacterium]|nr:Coenzyme F420 hydrogenase/dehydrogenase, beta subunit C-terminal domain [Deltaproteobacteria bacterium]MBW2345104.1 Coenzyme F420 hydrogenase/dehydrogenase, beta subunit C-terminal domain [Deltaproteobacteria bacterium]
MANEMKGCKELISEVIEKDLCCLCGACAGSCPYLTSYKGRIVQMDNCTLSDGQCYQYCPRTPVDMDAASLHVFGVPYSEDEMGTFKDVFMARARDSVIKGKAQYGGTVTTLLSVAMEEGLIDSAILTRTADDKIPRPFVARNVSEVLQAAGSNYMACSVLEAYNRLPEDNSDKLAIVGVPCQVLAAVKMKMEPPRHRCSTDNIAFVIGLFCTWALSPPGFHDFLKTSLNLPSVIKFDIPPPPANRFDVYTPSGQVSLSLDQVREYIMPTCAYCLDMTAEFADVSVGSVEGVEGWNTLIVRTDEGARLVEKAKAKGVLEIDALPADKLAHLKEASLIKKKRALKKIINTTGDDKNLLYAGLSPSLSEKLLS